MYTQADILQAFRTLGIQTGDRIIVHTSLKSVGHVEGGPEAFCRAAMAAVGPDGLLLMPTFNHYEACGGTPGYYSPLETPTRNGKVADTFWRMPGVLRSLDPSHAFAAWGRDAQRYVGKHHLVPTMGHGSPLHLLEQDGGKIILVGCPGSNTFHHVVEMTNYTPCLGQRTEQYWVKLPEGSWTMLRTWGWREGGCPITDRTIYWEEMRRRGYVAEGLIGNAKTMVVKPSQCREVIEDYFSGRIGPQACATCPIRPRKVSATVPTDWDAQRKCLIRPAPYAGLAPLVDDCIAQQDAAALRHDTAALWQHSRPADFDSFGQEVAWAVKKADSFGLSTEVWPLPADGVTAYHSYTAPIGYRTRIATVDIVEPADLAGRWADRAQISNTAIVGTGHTEPNGITAELVLITNPAQLATAAIKGKIVFCPSHHVMEIRGLAIRHGAFALLSSFNTHKEGANREAVKWNNTWDSANDGWLPTAQAAKENFPGLVISPAQGERLTARLQAGGRVVAKLVVEGEYFSGTLPVFSALTAGISGEELWITGHLFEQGAWDNASGVVTSLHAGRILQRMIAKQGHLPRRGLRHVHSQECYGVLGLHALHPERLANVRASLCVDSVGISTSPVCVNPGLRASGDFTFRVQRECLRLAAQRLGAAWTESQSFEINCTLVADPRTGDIPTASLGSKGETSGIWHTNRDTSEVLNEPQLILAASAIAAWSAFLANAGTAEMEWVLAQYPAWLEEDRASGQILDGEMYLELLKRELRTIPLYADSAADAARLRTACADLVEKTRQAIAANGSPRFSPAGTDAQRERASKTCPKPLWAGPVLDAFFAPEDLKIVGGPKWDNRQLILASWCDGTRNLEDALRLTAQEMGEKKPLTLTWALAWVDGLVRSGKLVDMAKR